MGAGLNGGHQTHATLPSTNVNTNRADGPAMASALSYFKTSQAFFQNNTMYNEKSSQNEQDHRRYNSTIRNSKNDFGNAPSQKKLPLANAYNNYNSLTRETNLAAKMSQGVLGSTGQHLSLPPQQTSASDISVVVN